MSGWRPGQAQQPLAGRTVVLTRSTDDNRFLASRLTALGADVKQIPLNVVLPAPDGGVALGKALERLADYEWLVLTSANGVRAVVDQRGAVPWPEGVHVAVVGDTTARVADAAGLPVNFIPSEASAARLVAEFPTALVNAAPVRVLAPLAELASSTVYDGLSDKGYDVDRVTAYRTGAPKIDQVLEPVQRSLAEGADVVVFAAPSAVVRFADRFGSTSAAVVCIGPSTAKRAQNLGFVVAAVATPHDDDGIYEAVQAVLTSGVG